LFPPPLRSGGNAALSGGACLSPPLRCGENQALETDAPPGHRSAPRYAKQMNAKMRFTVKQGQYLAFIYNYSKIHGRAPAEADLERYFRTTPPTIHQMILKLEEKGLISRVPGQPRSIRLLLQPEYLPVLK